MNDYYRIRSNSWQDSKIRLLARLDSDIANILTISNVYGEHIESYVTVKEDWANCSIDIKSISSGYFNNERNINIPVICFYDNNCYFGILNNRLLQGVVENKYSLSDKNLFEGIEVVSPATIDITLNEATNVIYPSLPEEYNDCVFFAKVSASTIIKGIKIKKPSAKNTEITEIRTIASYDKNSIKEQLECTTCFNLRHSGYDTRYNVYNYYKGIMSAISTNLNIPTIKEDSDYFYYIFPVSADISYYKVFLNTSSKNASYIINEDLSNLTDVSVRDNYVYYDDIRRNLIKRNCTAGKHVVEIQTKNYENGYVNIDYTEANNSNHCFNLSFIYSTTNSTVNIIRQSFNGLVDEVEIRRDGETLYVIFQTVQTTNVLTVSGIAPNGFIIDGTDPSGLSNLHLFPLYSTSDKSGTTANRPTTNYIGRQYFDETLNKPIWWKGNAWVDATGATV